MKILRAIIISCCLVFIAFGCWKIYSIQSEYHAGEQAYGNLSSYISPAPAAKEQGSEERTVPADSEETFDELEQIEFPVVDFVALREINPGVVGWLCCEDTAINYPVAQGPNNDYYLDHVFDGQPNGSGAIFLNSRNQPDFTDQNNIIFGHNMKNGTMFADLIQFKQQEFYEEHPRFLLMTPERNYVMDVFAGAVMAEWNDVWQISFADDAEMENWLQNIAAKSKITTDVHPTPADTILALSTCSSEYDGARFVVLGVLRAVEK